MVVFGVFFLLLYLLPLLECCPILDFMFRSEKIYIRTLVRNFSVLICRFGFVLQNKIGKFVKTIGYFSLPRHFKF